MEEDKIYFPSIDKDQFSAYGLRMYDFKDTAPEPDEHLLQVPGRSDPIDLSEVLSGDIEYRQGHHKIRLVYPEIDGHDITHTQEDFERVKTKIKRDLHGKRMDYVLSFDPEFTFTGRIKVSFDDDKFGQTYGIITLDIDYDPYKRRKDVVVKVDAVGGELLHLQSGRKRVSPKFETSGYLKVIFNGKEHVLPAGTWTINDIIFEEGTNDLYVCSYEIRSCTYADLETNGITYEMLKTKPIFEWYKMANSGSFVGKTWSDYAGTTWAQVANLTWGDVMYNASETESIPNVFIEYEWSEI